MTDLVRDGFEAPFTDNDVTVNGTFTKVDCVKRTGGMSEGLALAIFDSLEDDEAAMAVEVRHGLMVGKVFY